MKVLILKYLFSFAFALVLNVYEAHAHVQLDFPKGGEYFQPGQTITIKRHIVIVHPQNNWDIFMSLAGRVNWSILKADLPVI